MDAPQSGEEDLVPIMSLGLCATRAKIRVKEQRTHREGIPPPSLGWSGKVYGKGSPGVHTAVTEGHSGDAVGKGLLREIYRNIPH